MSCLDALVFRLSESPTLSPVAACGAGSVTSRSGALPAGTAWRIRARPRWVWTDGWVTSRYGRSPHCPLLDL